MRVWIFVTLLALAACTATSPMDSSGDTSVDAPDSGDSGVVDSGEPRKLSFGVSDEEAWDVGLACGGTVEVWVERVE